jgi:hypothetical protein
MRDDHDTTPTPPSHTTGHPLAPGLYVAPNNFPGTVAIVGVGHDGARVLEAMVCCELYDYLAERGVWERLEHHVARWDHMAPAVCERSRDHEADIIAAFPRAPRGD